MKRTIPVVLMLALLMGPRPACAECAGVTVGAAVLLNIIPGFGVGSFARGDQKGGSIQLTADLVGLGLVGVELLVASTDASGWDLMIPLMILGTAGMGTSFASRIWGVGRAISTGAGGGVPAPGHGSAAAANPFWYSMANVVFPGFGIGSFAQGDRVGGWVQVCLEGVGYGLLMLQMVSMQSGGPDVDVQTLGYVSWSVVGGARYVWGAIRPLWYAACSRSRQTGNALSLEVAPCLCSSADRVGFDPGVRLALRVEME